MAGHQETLDADAIDVKDLPVLQQDLLVVDGHPGQLIQVVDDPAAHLAGEIAVLDLPHIQSRAPEQAGAVRLHCPYMVGILVGDEDVADGLGVDAQMQIS